MKKPVRIGVFSGYDPRPWVMEASAAHDAKIEDIATERGATAVTTKCQDECSQLGIGYTVWNRGGRMLYKPS